MVNFHGLDPEPCVRCKTTDQLEFCDWIEGRTTHQTFRTLQSSVTRTEVDEPTVLFECSVCHFLVKVQVPPAWRPPTEWKR